MERVIPVTATFSDATAADQVLGFHRVTQRATDRGTMTHEQGRTRLDHLGGTDAFFAAVTLYPTVCSEP